MRHNFRTTTRSLALLLLIAAATAHRTAYADGIESFTEPYRTIDVAAVEAGIVLERHVKEGDPVEQSQPLASLNQAVLQASLAVAKVQRDATSTLKAAEAELRLRSDRLENLKELRLDENASEEEVLRARLEHEIAESRLLAAKENLEVKRLEYERIRLQIERRIVRSPVTGFVTEIYRDLGEYVSPADPVVVTIVQLNPLRANFAVPVSEIDKVKVGSTMEVRLDGLKKPIKGKVEVVSRVTNAESQTVRVRVEIPNPTYKYRSGSKCWLNIPGYERLTEKPGTTRKN